eukprot:15315017-Alexandrium_andersonii.AAC.1
MGALHASTAPCTVTTTERVACQEAALRLVPGPTIRSQAAPGKGAVAVSPAPAIVTTAPRSARTNHSCRCH